MKLTDERECYDLVDVLRRWYKVRDDSGYTAKHPGWKTEPQLFAELAKSRLLWWLLSGHEPLELPPPTYMSGPQHEISDGEWQAFEPPREVAKSNWLMGHYGPGNIEFGGLVPYWTLVGRDGDDWLLTMPGRLPGVWRISRGPDLDVPHYVGSDKPSMVPTAQWLARRIDE